jgi:hypothetical protein
MRSTYIAIGKAGIVAAPPPPWLSPMVRVEVAELEGKDTNQRGRT